MRWFVFPPVSEPNRFVIVEAKNLDSATKRLDRFGKMMNKSLSKEPLHGGKGYTTMTEAWYRCGEVTVVHGDV